MLSFGQSPLVRPKNPPYEGSCRDAFGSPAFLVFPCLSESTIAVVAFGVLMEVKVSGLCSLYYSNAAHQDNVVTVHNKIWRRLSVKPLRAFVI